MIMTKKISALIVDDEELARSDLKALLSEIDYTKVVGEANNISSAIDLIKKHKPDVVFLDIQFPRESGFDLLEKINASAKIVFVTAYDKYAIRAFEVNAIDYLIKPVDPERLTITIERIISNKKLSKEEKPLKYSDSIFIEHNNSFYFVKLADIVFITAFGAYSKIFTRKEKHLVAHKSMQEWENRLPHNTFIRIHRSNIINVDYIENIDRWYKYSLRVKLKGIEEYFSISRRYVASIRKRMT